MAIPRRRWTSAPSKGSPDGAKSTVFIHHTVSPNRSWSKAQERAHLREIRAGHLARGFSDMGYHFLLFPSGRLYEGRDVRLVPAAQEGANTGTIAIAYVGNTDTRDVTRRARLRLRVALLALKANWRVRFLRGHRDAGSTACPGGKLYRRLPSLRRFSGLR